MAIQPSVCFISIEWGKLVSKISLFLRIIILVVVSQAGFITKRSAGASFEPAVGPYAVIQLPLEVLPALPGE